MKVVVLILSLVISYVFALAKAEEIIDFGDQNVPLLGFKYQLLKAGKAPAGTKFNIIQFGDSHTASDTFTAYLRRMLREEIGNGGIGWVTPMNVGGQIHQLVNFHSSNWVLVNSRTKNSAEFPMGGFIAEPRESGESRIMFESRERDTDPFEAVFLVQRNKKNLTVSDASGKKIELKPTDGKGLWAHTKAIVKFPFTVTASSSGSSKLGGVWLSKIGQSGVEVSPIGANGIRQNVWGKWNKSWYTQLENTNADIVIIAYGTNESFDDRLNIARMKADLVDGIRGVRQVSPNAVILLFGIPDTVNVRENRTKCNQPYRYQEVQKAQREVAKAEKVLFWDWQKAMGGDCQMREWQKKRLVGNDLIHFTSAGYRESAALFYSGFSKFINGVKLAPSKIERVSVASASKFVVTTSSSLEGLLENSMKGEEESYVEPILGNIVEHTLESSSVMQAPKLESRELAIHIGDYGDYRLAQSQARLVARYVKKGKMRIVKAHDVYKAFLMDFSLIEAEKTCSELKKQNITCVILDKNNL